MLDRADFAQFLLDRFGLPVFAEAKSVPEGQSLVIRPAEIPHTIGFAVEFLIGWRSLEAKFIPGGFAAELVRAMHAADPDQKAAFKIFSESAISKGAQLQVRINNTQVEPVYPENWPKEWKTVEIFMRKGALLLDPSNADSERETVYPWAARFFGIIIALLPLEPIEAYSPQEEGAVYETKIRRYERSRINRAACIEIHGLRCKGCNFLFSEKYGVLGNEFIHIHHTEPVSMMGGSYIVNPATDLIPVCPNCHAMLHRRKPPLSITELKSYLT